MYNCIEFHHNRIIIIVATATYYVIIYETIWQQCRLLILDLNMSLYFKDDYNPHHGGKWSVDDLLFYISSLHGSEASELLWDEVCWVIGIAIFFLNNKMLLVFFNCENFRTFAESRCSDDAQRSSLLRVLRLRYHHRFQPETVAHWGQCIAVVIDHDQHGSFLETEFDRRHFERGSTSRWRTKVSILLIYLFYPAYGILIDWRLQCQME